MDQLVRIEYLNSGALIDIDGYPVKAGSYAYVWLNRQKSIDETDRQVAEFYGRLILALSCGIFSFWITLSIATRKSVVPALIVLMTFQQFFYLGCIDLYLDDKTLHFFSFFKIFRLEHPKI